MEYQNHFLDNEDEYRDHFETQYLGGPIVSFDGISVQFRANDFDHAFFESENRREGDKSLFAIRRAWRINWIRQTLSDNSCELKAGWVKSIGAYDRSRKVYINCEGYVVIVRKVSNNNWRFVTAFQPDAATLTKIQSGPDW